MKWKEKWPSCTYSLYSLLEPICIEYGRFEVLNILEDEEYYKYEFPKYIVKRIDENECKKLKRKGWKIKKYSEFDEKFEGEGFC